MKLLNNLFKRAAVPEAAGTRKLQDAMYREVTIRQDQIDDDSRTIDLAFSSDAPVHRNMWGWKFNEILDHNEKSIRLDRLRDGGALLMDHDHRDQVGVVESVRVEDGKCRATVRFSKSARASEIFADVQDGIRSKISVGYRIHAYEEKDGGPEGVDEIRITDWEPFEVSFVSIPADATVGVGRDFQTEQHQETEMFKKTASPAPDEAREDKETTAVGEGGQPERAEDKANDYAEREAEIKEILAIGEKYGESELAREMVDLDGTLSEFKARIRAKRDNVKPIPQRDTSQYIDMREQYSGKLRGFKSEEDAYRAGMWVKSWMFGDTRAHQWCKDHGMRVMTEGKVTKGGAVVPHEMSSAIIDLREEYGVMRNLLRVVPMTSDSLDVPRRTGGLTAYAVSEEDAITASDKSWDMINLTPKKFGVLARFSRDYAEDAIIDVAQDLASEAAYAFAQKEDECAIDGDGTSTYHGIVGFRSKMVDGNHAGAYIDATAGDDQFAELIASDLDLVRGTLPQYAAMRGEVCWLASKYAKNVVFDGITRAAGGNTQTMLGGNLVDAYLGDEIKISQAMPSASTAYNELVMLLYGNFKLAATMGDRRSFSFKVLDERYAEYDQIGVVATTRFDINVHDIGDSTNPGPVIGLRGNTS